MARGGKREGAGRPPLSGETRVQASVVLTPAAWRFIEAQRREGESKNQALERIIREHPQFPQEQAD